MKKKIFALAVAAMAVLGAQAQNYLDMEISSLPNLKWATEDSGSGTFNDSEVNWGGKWRFPTLEEWKNLLDACSQSYDSTTKTLTLKYGYGDKILTFKDVEEGTIYWAGDEPYAWTTTTYIAGQGNVKVTTYYPSYVKFEDGKFVSCRGAFEGYVDKVSISNTNGRVRPVATMGKVVISDIPDGWTVNGMAPTDGKVSVDTGSKLTVVPGQTPGKKIKSIRLDPVTE